MGTAPKTHENVFFRTVPDYTSCFSRSQDQIAVVLDDRLEQELILCAQAAAVIKRAFADALTFSDRKSVV